MTQATDDVGMAHSIERHGFVLKILNQRLFKFGVLVTLEQNIQGLDDDFAKALISGGGVARQIDFRITPAPQTLLNVVTSIEPALE